MSLGSDWVKESQRIRALVSASAETASAEEINRLAAQLNQIKLSLGIETRRIPEVFERCPYHQELKAEIEEVNRLLVQLYNKCH